MAGFNNDVVFGSNFNFSGGTAPSMTINGQLLIGNSIGSPQIGLLTFNAEFMSITTGNGEIEFDISPNFQVTGVHSWNGSLLETTSVTVTSDGAVITCNVEKEGGGDLTVVFSDGFYDWDTTPPDTVTLVAGTDEAPQLNFIYFSQDTKTLLSSTTFFPLLEESARICVAFCQSAASLQTNGAYKVQVWTDHLTGLDQQGHISDINFWIRQQNATWEFQVTQTYTITSNGGSPDNVLITTSDGIILQLHAILFPEFLGNPDYYVINDFTTPYNIVNDLNALLTDSNGNSMTGKYFSLVLWGVVSEDLTDSKLFINLPSGSYNNQSSLDEDLLEFANFTIPNEFQGTGFLISEWKLRHQNSGGGTWTSIQEIDLRGLEATIVPGGTSGAPSQFSDIIFRIFDDLDDTKKIAFQASSITSANTRTIIMADEDVDLSTVSHFVWNEIAGPAQSAVVDNGYITNNAALVTVTLPVTASIGDIVRVVGKGSGGWRVAQNVGQSIRLNGATTSVGVGGMLDSTGIDDTVEILCDTIDFGWIVISSVGTITVT